MQHRVEKHQQRRIPSAQGLRSRSTCVLRRLSPGSTGQGRGHRACPRSVVELGVEPREVASEPERVRATPHSHPMRWDVGTGAQFGVTTKRSLSLSLTIRSSLLLLGEVGRQGCPTAWSSPARPQGQGLRTGPQEEAQGRGGAIFQKNSPSTQASFLLLSKSLAFLEVKDSAAEELVRPVCALRNQARAKLEGTGAWAPARPPGCFRLPCSATAASACPVVAWLPNDTGAPAGKAKGAPGEGQRGAWRLFSAHSSLLPSDTHPLTRPFFKGPPLSSKVSGATGMGMGSSSLGQRRQMSGAGRLWAVSLLWLCRTGLGLSRYLHSVAYSWPLSFH